MTATASRADMNGITDSLGLKNCKYIIGNPDRKNIFYEKVFRHGQDLDAIESILIPIAKDQGPVVRKVDKSLSTG